MENVQVYVVEEFIRNDEFCEHNSGVLGVFDTEEAAIKHAKSVVDDYFNLYGNKREEEPNDILKYYCCLDSDPECEGTYPNYLTITVTEHILNKSNS